MSLIRKIFYYFIHNPKVLVRKSLNVLVERLSPLLSDKLYIKLKCKLALGYWPNLKEPKTFNEKLQWLKLYNRNPEYTIMADKVKVKEWVASKIGEEYIIPTLGVWDDPDKIDFESLPNQFVLKCNHNSGIGLCICKDKSEINVEAVKEELRKGLKQDYFLHGREWPYKNIPRRILAEKYMEDVDNKDGLLDYKIMCFNGSVKCSFVCSDRYSEDGLRVTFFDRCWNKMPFERHYKSSEKEIAKPYKYDKMIELAEKLSENIPFVRVDFYVIEKKLYFGEMTFFPGSGLEEFHPEEWDRRLGDLIELPG